MKMGRTKYKLSKLVHDKSSNSSIKLDESVSIISKE